jgi:hypothetical protein
MVNRSGKEMGNVMVKVKVKGMVTVIVIRLMGG